MKKILNYLRSQKGLFTVGGFAFACFAVGLFNSMGWNANTFAEFFWWGRLATVGFVGSFLLLTIAFGIAPIVANVINLFKKKNN